MDASAAGDGKLAFTLRRADRRRRRDQPVQLPAQPRRAQARARDRGRLPGRAEAREPDTARRRSRSRASCSTSAGCPPATCNVVTGGGGTVGNAIVDHADIALITFTGSPEVGWGIKAPRAAQEGRPRARQQRAADHRAERRRRDRREEGLGRRASATPGQSCISTQRIYVHESTCSERVPRRARPARRRARRRRPARRADRRVGAHLDRANATACSRGSTKRSRRAPRCSPAARSAKTACSCRRCSATSRPT